MATAEELITLHRDGHVGMVEVARVVTSYDKEGKDDIVLDVLLLDAEARTEGDDVALTDIYVAGDGDVLQDHVYLNADAMTQMAVAWLGRQGYTVTPPATARGSE